VAVGTTSTRLLETAAQVSGDACLRESEISAGSSPAANSGDACKKIVKVHPYNGHTDLFIRPPYNFRAVDVLMTNFHLPKTTLLILVRTFGGDDLIRRAYAEAVCEEYRFYSYGDSMIIL
jgi:S-adenosylmethionine:tRNA ribosyltransferase-isomerase